MLPLLLIDASFRCSLQSCFCFAIKIDSCCNEIRHWIRRGQFCTYSLYGSMSKMQLLAFGNVSGNVPDHQLCQIERLYHGLS